MRVAQTAANAYQSTGNTERALALHRQIVAIADLTISPNEPQRGSVRINAAYAFARAQRFEEAERLANEAVAIGERMRPPQANLFAPQVEQIRRMKAAAESGSARTDAVGTGTAAGRFTYGSPDGTPNSIITAPTEKSGRQ